MKNLLIGLSLLASMTSMAFSASASLVCEGDLMENSSVGSTVINLNDEDQFDGCSFSREDELSVIKTNKGVIAQCQVIASNDGELTYVMSITKNDGKFKAILTRELDFDYSNTINLVNESVEVTSMGSCKLQ
ncbi:MAG: hypothetical protein ACJAT2_002853 [Bacteriovoracaceae bacterium]|jgi:hypothetical protein